MSAAEQFVSVCGETVSAKMLALMRHRVGQRTGRRDPERETAFVYELIAEAPRRLRSGR